MVINLKSLCPTSLWSLLPACMPAYWTLLLCWLLGILSSVYPKLNSIIFTFSPTSFFLRVPHCPRQKLQSLLWLFSVLPSHVWSKIKSCLTYFLIIFRLFSFPNGPTPVRFQVILATHLAYWNCLTCLPLSFPPGLSQKEAQVPGWVSVILWIPIYNISMAFLMPLRAQRWLTTPFLSVQSPFLSLTSHTKHHPRWTES